MRVMVKGKEKIEVYEHWITRNLWEFYVCKDKKNEFREALVIGNFIEFGLVSFEEVKPFLISTTKDLTEIMPATGWRWEDDEC